MCKIQILIVQMLESAECLKDKWDKVDILWWQSSMKC